jgi:hypothetical protein
MQMRVSNRLAGSLANIDSDVVAVRRRARFDVPSNCWKEGPDSSLFLPGKSEEISFVSSRHYQAVAVIQWESIRKRSGVFVHCNEVSASEPVAENTIQFVSPKYPTPRAMSLWRTSSVSATSLPAHGLTTPIAAERRSMKRRLFFKLAPPVGLDAVVVPA